MDESVSVRVCACVCVCMCVRMCTWIPTWLSCVVVYVYACLYVYELGAGNSCAFLVLSMFF